ncbi:MAG: hypothetical protein KatS3mg022_3480 [Armatimonadota bacterium]|nr:MAG: hypothetical protein KatS3mg022_3480 [Armatimonadota bacterium]
MEQTLEERIRQLPADLQQEVSDFIDFLLERRRRQKHPPTFSWAGALKDMRDQYTSVDLQHEAAEWRAQTDEIAH